MATKVGILSDRKLRDNCLEYEAFPIGFANADFEGNVGNPFLNGIKTPKYQRSASKPVSADVMAVNSAKFMQGNSFSNARNILRQYQKEVKEWKPPPVKLLSAATEWDRVYDELEKQDRAHEVFDYQTRDKIRKEMNDRFYSTPQPKLAIASRGTQMVRATIGTQAENPEITSYIEMYNRAPNKREIASRLKSALEGQNVVTIESSQSVPEMLRTTYSIGAVIDLKAIFTPDVTAAAVHLGTRGIQERRGSFQEPKPRSRSQQQGIPEATTAPLTPEIERK